MFPKQYLINNGEDITCSREKRKVSILDKSSSIHSHHLLSLLNFWFQFPRLSSFLIHADLVRQGEHHSSKPILSPSYSTQRYPIPRSVGASFHYSMEQPDSPSWIFGIVQAPNKFQCIEDWITLCKWSWFTPVTGIIYEILTKLNMICSGIFHQPQHKNNNVGWSTISSTTWCATWC